MRAIAREERDMAASRRRLTHHRDAAVRKLGLAEEEDFLLGLGREAERVCGGGRSRSARAVWVGVARERRRSRRRGAVR